MRRGDGESVLTGCFNRRIRYDLGRSALCVGHVRLADALANRNDEALPADHRRDQQREDHGEAGSGSDVDYQLDRQERDDSKGDPAARDEHADEIPKTRPDNGDPWGQRIGVDDGGDRVGRVVKAVYGLKTQRQPYGEEQEDDGRGGSAAAGKVFKRRQPSIGGHAPRSDRATPASPATHREFRSAPTVRRRFARLPRRRCRHPRRDLPRE